MRARYAFWLGEPHSARLVVRCPICWVWRSVPRKERGGTYRAICSVECWDERRRRYQKKFAKKHGRRLDLREPMAREIKGRGRVNPWKPSDPEPLSPPFAGFFLPSPVFQADDAKFNGWQERKNNEINDVGLRSGPSIRKSGE